MLFLILTMVQAIKKFLVGYVLPLVEYGCWFLCFTYSILTEIIIIFVKFAKEHWWLNKPFALKYCIRSSISSGVEFSVQCTVFKHLLRQTCQSGQRRRICGLFYFQFQPSQNILNKFTETWTVVYNRHEWFFVKCNIL